MEQLFRTRAAKKISTTETPKAPRAAMQAERRARQFCLRANQQEQLLSRFLIGKLPKRQPSNRFDAVFEAGVQVDGCARDGSMPEQLLHNTQIGAAAE